MCDYSQRSTMMEGSLEIVKTTTKNYGFFIDFLQILEYLLDIMTSVVFFTEPTCWYNAGEPITIPQMPQ